MKFPVTVSLFFVFIPCVFGLNCHKCSSTESWEQCNSVQRSTTVTCSGSDARCYKAHYSTNDETIKLYAKGCGPKSVCQKENNPVCKSHLGPSDCEVHCCEENMCNAGSYVGLSSFLAAASAFVVMNFVAK